MRHNFIIGGKFFFQHPLFGKQHLVIFVGFQLLLDVVQEPL